MPIRVRRCRWPRDGPSKRFRISGYLANNARMTSALSCGCSMRDCRVGRAVLRPHIELGAHRNADNSITSKLFPPAAKCNGAVGAGQVRWARRLDLIAQLIQRRRAYEIHRREQVPRRQIVEPGIVELIFLLVLASLADVPLPVVTAEGICAGRSSRPVSRNFDRRPPVPGSTWWRPCLLT